MYSILLLNISSLYNSDSVSLLFIKASLYSISFVVEVMYDTEKMMFTPVFDLEELQ